MKELTQGSPYDRAKKIFQTQLKTTDILQGDDFWEEICLSDGFSLRSYTVGETVYTPTVFEKSLIFFLEGRGIAIKTQAGGNVIVSRFREGDICGLAALFGKDENYASVIRITGTSALLAFVPQHTVADILSRSSQAALSYIRLLSDKIRFLNTKLDSYTAPSALAKLCLYLMEHERSILPMSTLAMELNISRMTLYRALDELTADGCIEKSEKTIRVINKEKLLFHLDEDKK